MNRLGEGRATSHTVASMTKAATIVRAQNLVGWVLVDVSTSITSSVTSMTAMTSSIWGAPCYILVMGASVTRLLPGPFGDSTLRGGALIIFVASISVRMSAASA